MKTEILLHEQQVHAQSERWFYIVMAIIAIAIAIAGFGPGAVSTAGRRAPITWAVASHVAIFSAWLLLFLTQTILISKRKIAVHRRLGYMAALLAVLMIVTGYITAINMARRGYDLSGDLTNDNNEPMGQLLFQLGDILSFGILVALAIWYR